MGKRWSLQCRAHGGADHPPAGKVHGYIYYVPNIILYKMTCDNCGEQEIQSISKNI